MRGSARWGVHLALFNLLGLLLATGLAGPCRAMGVAILQAPGAPSGPVTVWYPSKAPETTRAIGDFALTAAWDGDPDRGNGALIVLSHGSGGSALPYHDIARVLVESGFVVAAPEHDGDNWHDQTKTGPASWKQRPVEISSAIDRVQADPRFASLLGQGRVGVYGMSAGGLSALEFSGATWSLNRLVKHCADHFEEDLGFCTFPEAASSSGKLDDKTMQRLRNQYFEGARSGMVDATEYGAHDPRVKAVVAAVPVAAVIDPASLSRARVPTALIPAERDQLLSPKWHVLAVENACRSCITLGALRGGGHLSILSPLPESVIRGLGPWAKDPPGFDRTSVIALYKRIAQFFREHV